MRLLLLMHSINFSGVHRYVRCFGRLNRLEQQAITYSVYCSSVLQVHAQQSGKANSQKGCLQYLDFFEELLSPDGCSLAESLGLDGTHLSPAYLHHMSNALGRIK